MKKRVLLALLAVMVVLSLAACGKEKKKKATELCQLGQYKGIEVEKLVITVSDDDVMNNIYSNLKGKAVEVTGFPKVELHDVVDIDFTGYVDGVAFSGGSGNEPSLIIGSGTFIPGFEEGLIGAEKGTKVKVFVTFPEEYGAEELAGKEAVFEVTVNTIKRYPEFTDEFIAENSSYKTLAEYQAGVRSNLEANAENEIESQFKSDVLSKVVELCTFDETLAEDAKQYAQETRELYESYANSYGISFEMFLYYMLGTTVEYFEKYLPEMSEFNVKVNRVYDAIAEVEGLKVTEEEYSKMISDLMEESGTYTTREQVEEAYGKDNINDYILDRKAEDIIFNSAVAK